ncbi:hypothetical protein MTsN3n11_17940 [Qipengyuania sp. MTN3-11]
MAVLAVAGSQASAQDGVEQSGDPVFIEQAGGTTVDPRESVYGHRTDRGGGVANSGKGEDSETVAQISSPSIDPAMLTQLSETELSTLLAQLSAAEREVLLEKVQGTDICNEAAETAAIRRLCANRIETRSQEFRQARRNALSPEERLLGEALEETRSMTFDNAIRRLAQNVGTADDADNQAIASVALAANPPPQPGAVPETPTGAGELSAETQALINAIVEQLGGRPGGS